MSKWQAVTANLKTHLIFDFTDVKVIVNKLIFGLWNAPRSIYSGVEIKQIYIAVILDDSPYTNLAPVSISFENIMSAGYIVVVTHRLWGEEFVS